MSNKKKSALQFSFTPCPNSPGEGAIGVYKGHETVDVIAIAELRPGHGPQEVKIAFTLTADKKGVDTSNDLSRAAREFLGLDADSGIMPEGCAQDSKQTQPRQYKLRPFRGAEGHA